MGSWLFCISLDFWCCEIWDQCSTWWNDASDQFSLPTDSVLLLFFFYMILSASFQINYQTVQRNRDKRRGDKVGKRFLVS